MEDTKKCFVYFLEQLLKEEREAEKEEEAGEVDKEDGYITLLFDCSSAGLKNLDLEFMQERNPSTKQFFFSYMQYFKDMKKSLKEKCLTRKRDELYTFYTSYLYLYV